MTIKPKKRTKKENSSQQPSKYELIPYVDYLTDTRKIAAAQVLAYSGYERENIGFEQSGKGDEFLRPVLILKRLTKEMFFGIPLSTTPIS